MASPNDLWHLRKHMTTSMSSFIFMTYVMSMADRRPQRIHISRATGKMHTSDMVPCEYFSTTLIYLSRTKTDLRSLSRTAIVPGKPELVHGEPVPFRFTPNFQRFIGPHGIEGLLTSSLVATARALTESEVCLPPLRRYRFPLTDFVRPPPAVRPRAPALDLCSGRDQHVVHDEQGRAASQPPRLCPQRDRCSRSQSPGHELQVRARKGQSRPPGRACASDH